MARLWTLALLALAALAGCERKAPGPVECVAFAENVVAAIAYPGESARSLHAKYEELVRQCLTTPYDRAMLACVERTGQYRACRTAFEIRRHQATSR